MPEIKVDSKPTSEEFIRMEQDFKVLCRNVFSSGKGKDLMDQLERIYVDGKLFQENDRDTVYCIAQRDLIMELKYNSEGS